MVTLEVIIHTPHSLKVVELMGGLTFTGGEFTRNNGCDEFLFEGDEATLAEALRRLVSVPEAICVLQEVALARERRTCGAARGWRCL